MSNLVDWAQKELDLLFKNNDEMQILINKDIIDIVKLFSEQGHSGFTAKYSLNVIKRLLDWKPITPLTGEDNEWGEPYGKDNIQQNKRCSAVFRKNFDNSTAYYIDGKIFSDNGGKTWYTNNDSIVPITFPYMVPDEPEKIILGETP